MERRRHLKGGGVGLVALGLSVTTGIGAQVAGGSDPRFPSSLESHIGEHAAKLSASERRRLQDGGAVVKLLDSDISREVAVSGVTWIGAPVSRYLDSFRDIERHESGQGFHATRRLSTPPKLEEFADLTLPAVDVQDLISCRVGHCDLQLSEHAIGRFQKELHTRRPDAQAVANQLMRRWLFEYVNGYLEGGNQRLAVYRDTSTPVPVERELRTIVDHSVSLAPYPELRRYLLEFPNATLPGADGFFYWQEASFGLKRTIHVSHVVIAERPQETVVTSKMLYATHYFWSALDVRVLVPDPARGTGFWFVTASRTRLEGLSGFTGFFVRRRVRSQVQDGTMKVLLTTKQKLETANQSGTTAPSKTPSALSSSRSSTSTISRISAELTSFFPTSSRTTAAR